MFKVSDLNYRTQNDFGLAIVSTDNLSESSEKEIKGRVKFAYRVIRAMWTAMPKFSLRILNLNPEC